MSNTIEVRIRFENEAHKTWAEIPIINTFTYSFKHEMLSNKVCNDLMYGFEGCEVL